VERDGRDRAADESRLLLAIEEEAMAAQASRRVSA
jgi:hypothetical protein